MLVAAQPCHQPLHRRGAAGVVAAEPPHGVLALRGIVGRPERIQDGDTILGGKARVAPRAAERAGPLLEAAAAVRTLEPLEQGRRDRTIEGGARWLELGALAEDAV